MSSKIVRYPVVPLALMIILREVVAENGNTAYSVLDENNTELFVSSNVFSVSNFLLKNNYLVGKIIHLDSKLPVTIPDREKSYPHVISH